MKLELRALDLFCGLGGWSDGLAMEGFEVLGVEILPRIVRLYKHPCVIADVTTLDGRRLRGFDLIVGSPPCRDFSSLANVGKTRWKRPPNPEGEGLRLVRSFLQIVQEAEPTYWLMENVPGLSKYLDIPPRTTTYLGTTMRRCFWGNYPSFLVPLDMTKPPMEGMYNWDGMASAKRARIPLPTARALGRAVRDAMDVNPGLRLSTPFYSGSMEASKRAQPGRSPPSKCQIACNFMGRSPTPYGICTFELMDMNHVLNERG